jgi:hypothetical protein
LYLIYLLAGAKDATAIAMAKKSTPGNSRMVPPTEPDGDLDVLAVLMESSLGRAWA